MPQCTRCALSPCQSVSAVPMPQCTRDHTRESRRHRAPPPPPRDTAATPRRAASHRDVQRRGAVLGSFVGARARRHEELQHIDHAVLRG
eukprot:5466882-Prymnesium_polylepis.1